MYEQLKQQLDNTYSQYLLVRDELEGLRTEILQTKHLMLLAITAMEKEVNND